MTTRECGSCSLCCKVLDVPAVYKPAGQWCKHFATGTGCNIHQLRPKACRTFSCVWLAENWLGDEWRPTACKFVMAYEYDGGALVVYPDPGALNSWRAEPFHTALRAIAEKHLTENRLVIISEPKRRFVLTPDQEIPVGKPQDVLGWHINWTSSPEGPRLHIDFEVMTDGKKGGSMDFSKEAAAARAG